MKLYPTKKTMLAILRNHGDLPAHELRPILNRLRAKKGFKPLSTNRIANYLTQLKKDKSISVTNKIKVEWCRRHIAIYTAP